MPVTTEITSIIELTDLTALAGDFAADFDLGAARRAYVAAIEEAAQLLVPSITIHGDGEVIAAFEDRAAARAIVWAEITADIDGYAILNRYQHITVTSAVEAARVQLDRSRLHAAIRTVRALAVSCGSVNLCTSGALVEATFGRYSAADDFHELLTALQRDLGATGIVRVESPTRYNVLVKLAEPDA